MTLIDGDIPPMRILITGGAGFIGSHIVDLYMRTTDAHITVIDRLDCAGNLNRLAEWAKNPRLKFFYDDLRAPVSEQRAKQLGDFDYVFHLGAATHVDRSLVDPLAFVFDNVVATCNILQWARGLKNLQLFVYFSTDEVFGPAKPGESYDEWARYNSGNPYSATKAGAEELTLAFGNTWGLPIVVSHCMNVLGRKQHREKVLPTMIRRINDGAIVKLHTVGGVIGSRTYIDATLVAEAVKFLAPRAQRQDKYNIVGGQEVTNLELATMIAARIGKPLRYQLTDYDRPGYDARYALSGAKMKAMGWEAGEHSLEHALDVLVPWYLEHPEWL